MSTVTRAINVATEVYGGNDDVVIDVLVNGVKNTSFTIHDGVKNPSNPEVARYNSGYSFNLDLSTEQNNTITFSTADKTHVVSIDMSFGCEKNTGYFIPSQGVSLIEHASFQDNYKKLYVDATTPLSLLITPGDLLSTMNEIIDIDGNGYADLQGTSAADYILLGGPKTSNTSIDFITDYLLSGTAHGGAGNDSIFAGTSHTYSKPTQYALYGDAGNDTLVGNWQGTGILNGGDGNDTIYDGYAAETLIGGAGRNTFILGYEARPYNYLTPAKDININTISYSKTNADNTRSFDDTITRSDTIDMSRFKIASFTQEGEDLLITAIQGDTVSVEQDTYRIEYYFNAHQPVGKLSFGGQDLRVQDVQQLLTTYGNNSVMGTQKADFFDLFDIEGGSSVIEGSSAIVLTGTIHLRQGDDTIYCGSGLNTVYGDQGNDTISNAAVAYGGSGNDTYMFDMTDMFSTVHKTTIIENSGANDKGDVLSLQNIAADQLWFTKSGKDLVISAIGNGCQATIQNWYGSQSAHIEQIKAGDKTLTDTNVSKLVSAMAAMTPPAAGQTTLPANYQTQLASVLAANWK